MKPSPKPKRGRPPTGLTRKPLHLNLPPELHEKLRRAAFNSRMSMSRYAEKLLSPLGFH
jgi:predicted HicB family RNase H-like nuclease